MSTFFVILIGQILVNNYVMCQFYGICPTSACRRKWTLPPAWAWP